MKDTKQTGKRIVPKKPVKIMIEREFIGEKSLAEAFIPVIYDDILRQLEEKRTIDNGGNVD